MPTYGGKTIAKIATNFKDWTGKYDFWKGAFHGHMILHGSRWFPPAVFEIAPYRFIFNHIKFCAEKLVCLLFTAGQSPFFVVFLV